MNPWEIYGHDWAVEMLQQHVINASLRQAYLLTGPSSIGKRTLALRLAQALNCPSPAGPGVPCLVCRSCRQIEAGKNIDVMMVQSEVEGGILKVEQVREVTKFLSLKPYQSQFKIIIFSHFEDTNANAQNALLKTLEEAPAYAVLLLTADNAEQLLPTIVSRCEILRLRPLNLPDLKSYLARRNVPEVQVDFLAHVAGGRPGYALRLLQDENTLAFRAEKLEDLRKLLSEGLVDRFHYAEKLARDKEILRQTLLIWLSYWRDVLHSASGSSVVLTNIDRAAEIEEISRLVSNSLARTVAQEIQKAVDGLDRNLNPRLLVEVTLMDWPRIK